MNISKCKTKEDILKVVNNHIGYGSLTAKEKKYLPFLVKKIIKAKTFNEAQQTFWDYILNSEMPIKEKVIERKSWFKGNAIHGMECHSAGHN